ncbi:alpha/beta fold hydrolase [Yinghuangia seranimata]|uniref:alpha/beta fold hydrolase n=1 Tax=Yinghuangia seranimata TaxID=408067 RepID=UPI00248B6F38|nr:alpha/beta hydrolase [Yinghuangia seranimata]MDI2124866.1 alpha/beta hydrolase [Yinghuangia seranimata]
MPRAKVNGVTLHYDIVGSGEPLVLVHGSWTDGHTWGLVVPALAERYQVLTYDRRGHTRSERPSGQGSRREDEDDLASLMGMLDAGPAHVAGSSFGGSTALGLASRHPELFRSLIVHEPPLMGVVADDPALAPAMQETGRRIAGVLEALRAGDAEGGAHKFVDEVALGPGMWDRLPEDQKQMCIGNAPTFLDEQADPGWSVVDLDGLGGLSAPALLTHGTVSPSWFAVIIERLARAVPGARVRTLEGAGHVPHETNPDDYVASVLGFLTDRG